MDKIIPIFQKESHFIGRELISNLPLQMSLYFNVILLPVWFISTIYMLQLKFDCFSSIYQVVAVTTITIIIILECLRLYLGFSGNLEEKIPDLAGFWMLSVLIQFPLQTFLTFNPHFQLHVTEAVLQCCMLVLLLVQLVSGYIALRTLAKHQFIQFQLLGFQTTRDQCKKEI